MTACCCFVCEWFSNDISTEGRKSSERNGAIVVAIVVAVVAVVAVVVSIVDVQLTTKIIKLFSRLLIFKL